MVAFLWPQKFVFQRGKGRKPMRDEGGSYLASISWRDDLFGMQLFITSSPLGTRPPCPEEPRRSTVGLGSHSARFTTSFQQTPAQLSQNRHTDRRHLSADDCCTFKIQWLVGMGWGGGCDLQILLTIITSCQEIWSDVSSNSLCSVSVLVLFLPLKVKASQA